MRGKRQTKAEKRYGGGAHYTNIGHMRREEGVRFEHGVSELEGPWWGDRDYNEQGGIRGLLKAGKNHQMGIRAARLREIRVDAGGKFMGWGPVVSFVSAPGGGIDRRRATARGSTKRRWRGHYYGWHGTLNLV
eukprot:g12178.t1